MVLSNDRNQRSNFHLADCLHVVEANRPNLPTLRPRLRESVSGVVQNRIPSRARPRGRPSVITAIDGRRIQTFIRRNPFSSIMQIKNGLSLNVSKGTIYNWLVKRRFKSKTPTKRIVHTTIQREARITWCYNHVNFDFKKV